MYYKVLALFAFAALVKCHDIAIGSNTNGRKIYEETKQASPAIWRQVDNVTITASDGEVISRVIVHDLRSEKDGEVKIIDGGEGHKNVTLELKSPTALRGYEFHIEVYAIPDLKSGDQPKSINGDGSDDISKDSTSKVPSKDNVPATIGKDETPRPVRTIMTEDKDSDVNINIPASVNKYTTVETENKESTDYTTEVPKSIEESNEENMKKSKNDAENHEIVDYVLEDMNDQSEKAALTSDSLRKGDDNIPIDAARANNSQEDADKMETTTQSDDMTSTTSSDNEEDYGKIDLNSSIIPPIVLKMEPPMDIEMPSSHFNRQEPRYNVPLMKNLGNQRN
ncbi:uncharacterized protein LOC119836814 [Zerene cesonia]|uniref:uncharacterized protein LOC119836814 n=1 Tax=Zerene cesonia TaxID=33412 RepID=UPI0018E4F393|nr:uncharacterized protein LOC119836814 [Zerene cesonia]